MDAVRHPECDRILKAPGCFNLPTKYYDDLGAHVSVWRPNEGELEQLQEGGVIRLAIFAPKDEHPPVSMETIEGQERYPTPLGDPIPDTTNDGRDFVEKRDNA